MIIRKTRLNNIDKIINKFFEKKVIIFKLISSANENAIKKLGFDVNELYISKIPKRINKYARINADGIRIIDKNAKKEICEQNRYVTQTRWAGRGHTKQVETMITFMKERYKRNYIQPYSVSFYLCKIKDNIYLVSEELMCSFDNKDVIKNTLNLILNIFNECCIDLEVSLSVNHKIIRQLEWKILPPGEYPWQKIKMNIKHRIFTKTENKIYEERFDFFEKFKFDFYAVGRDGFDGYVVMGFRNKDIFILESPNYGNAIYVFNQNWEGLSKKTKKEILIGEECIARIVHGKKWKIDVENTIKNYIK